MFSLRVLVALLFILSMWTAPVYAATTAGVTVTATPAYVSINNTPASVDFGTVQQNSTNWSNGSAPTFPLDDGECYFTMGNNGGVSINVTINATDWTGGVGWTLAGSVGENIVVLAAGVSGDGEAAMTNMTVSGTDYALTENLAKDATLKWELRLLTGTFTDGVQKSTTVTLTATQA